MLLRLLVFSVICLLSTLFESHSHYSADKKKKKLLLLNLALNWNGRNNKHLQRWSFLPDFSSVRNHSKSWENLSSSTLKQPWSYSLMSCMHASALFYFQMFDLLNKRQKGKRLPFLTKAHYIEMWFRSCVQEIVCYLNYIEKQSSLCIFFLSSSTTTEKGIIFQTLAILLSYICWWQAQAPYCCLVAKVVEKHFFKETLHNDSWQLKNFKSSHKWEY